MVLLGPLCLLLGWLGACARMFGWTSGLLPQQTFSLRVFGYLNLERGLLAGAGLLLAGLGLTLQLIYEWYASGSGPLEVHVILRHALWGFTAMALGVQTMLSMIRDDGHPRVTAVG